VLLVQRLFAKKTKNSQLVGNVYRFNVIIYYYFQSEISTLFLSFKKSVVLNIKESFTVQDAYKLSNAISTVSRKLFFKKASYWTELSMHR